MTELVTIRDAGKASDLDLWNCKNYANQMLHTFQTLQTQLDRMPLILRSLLEERGCAVDIHKLTEGYLKLLLTDMTMIYNEAV